MEGELTRVLMLPPDDYAVHVVIGDCQGMVLDPEEVDVLLVGVPASGKKLEFHLPEGVAITVEAV